MGLSKKSFWTAHFFLIIQHIGGRAPHDHHSVVEEMTMQGLFRQPVFFACTVLENRRADKLSGYNQSMSTAGRVSYIWDYDLNQDQFLSILDGKLTFGRLDQDWAAQRLIEYAPYEDIVRLIGFPRLVQNWPRWRKRIRSESRKRGLDFLVEWLTDKHPELLHG